MPLTLYHAPPSFYSQIARLVLVEKGVAFTAKLAAAGPPLFETYQPWYMRLNPGGTIPTLVDGDTAVPDSREILRYVDANLPGPALTPTQDDARARVDRWIAELYDVSIRELTYGSERMRNTAARVNGMRARQLRKLAARHAELRDVYEAKLRDIENFTGASQDPEAVAAQLQRMQGLLDELDRSLTAHAFVVGSDYTLADVVATVTVARMRMLGHDPCANRPALQAWFERMRGRPSFERADIWDHFKPARLIGMLARKLAPYLLVAALALGLLTWLLVWLT